MTAATASSAVLIGLAASPAMAATVNTVTENDVVVGYPAALSAGDTHWYTEDTRPGGSLAFTTAFGAPPSGLGGSSLELVTDSTNAAKVQLINHSMVGTPLADVTALSYWAYQAAGPSFADASFQLQIDTDGNLATTTDRTTLVYEPYWNGTVTAGSWQYWDVAAGQFWSSKTVSGFTAGLGGPPLYTLAQANTLAPNAVVIGIGANVGTYNPSYTVATDGLTFGTASSTVTYNFEHYPTSKDECKNGGWSTNFAPGQFANQGDCVSYVASNGRAH